MAAKKDTAAVAFIPRLTAVEWCGEPVSVITERNTLVNVFAGDVT